MVTFGYRLSRSALEATKMVPQLNGDGPPMISAKSFRFIKVEYGFEATPPVHLPLEIQAMIIEQVAADIGADNRIYSIATRNTLRALCTVNKYFESIAIRHLYTLVHLTSATQLAAFRKAIAYFGRPTALAKHVRTFSISSTTHIASYQFAQDLVTVLHALRPSVERLLLDVRRRHYFRQTSSSGGQDIGILQIAGPAISAIAVFGTPWPKLIEASVSEGLDQYLRLPHFPRAFDNVQRLALGYTAITTELVDRLLEMSSLEMLVMVSSSVVWSNLEWTTPAEPITKLMRKSPALRRLVWLVTQRPSWDMPETMGTGAVLYDANVLCSVPGVEVMYHGGQNTDETLADGLSGPRLVGEGARDGALWKL
ncbi:hypothetical protein FS749_015318 [Ceratobasidium sp. UAMH 11750]|nr:hypothetical protein FS749_015318 [Ceratobasidium sp. UAMH 11750]